MTTEKNSILAGHDRVNQLSFCIIFVHSLVLYFSTVCVRDTWDKDENCKSSPRLTSANGQIKMMSLLSEATIGRKEPVST